MKKLSLVFICTMLAIASSINAQKVMKRFMIAEGNSFGAPDNFVKLAAYYPELSQYKYRDSVLGDFTNDLLIDGDIAYMHVGNADPNKDRIYKFNINCHQKLDSVNIPGFQKMKIYNSKLIVSRGYGTDTNFIEIYDKNTFARISTFPEADLYCSEFTILGNRAYVAMNGSWPVYTDSGTIAVVDVNTNTFIRKIKLDTFARVANQVFAKGNTLYIISSNSYVTAYDLTTDTFENFYNGYIGSVYGIYNNKLYMDLGADRGYFDLTTKSFGTTGVYQAQYQLGFLDTSKNRSFFLYQNFSPLSSSVYSVNNSSLTLKDSFEIGQFTVGALYYAANSSSPVLSNITIYLPVNKDTTISYSGFSSDCDHHAWQLVSGAKRIGASVDSLNLGRYKYTPAVSLIAKDTFEVKVCDEAGACATSKVFIETYDPLSIESAEFSAVSIYPNPFENELILENLPATRTDVSIFDIQGKLIKSFETTASSHVIDLSSATKGIYIVKLTSPQGSKSLRVIKQ